MRQQTHHSKECTVELRQADNKNVLATLHLTWLHILLTNNVPSNSRSFQPQKAPTAIKNETEVELHLSPYVSSYLPSELPPGYANKSWATPCCPSKDWVLHEHWTSSTKEAKGRIRVDTLHLSVAWGQDRCGLTSSVHGQGAGPVWTHFNCRWPLHFLRGFLTPLVAEIV